MTDVLITRYKRQRDGQKQKRWTERQIERQTDEIGMKEKGGMGTKSILKCKFGLKYTKKSNFCVYLLSA